MIPFFARKNATAAIAKAREAIEAHNTFESPQGRDADGNFRYIVHDNADPHRKMNLALVPIVLKVDVPEIKAEDAEER